MVSKSEVERLRKEARTIFANLEEIDKELEEAMHEKGEHWDKGEIHLDMNSPDGEKYRYRT